MGMETQTYEDTDSIEENNSIKNAEANLEA
jgi:hypothetical protein